MSLLWRHFRLWTEVVVWKPSMLRKDVGSSMNGRAGNDYHVWNNAWARRPQSPEELWKEVRFLSFSRGIETKFVWRGLPSMDFEVKDIL
jgi:hypothetical protein